MNRVRTLAPFALATALIAGCTSTEVIQPNVVVSVGQQLIDLKQARDSGALTDKEYQRQKNDLIKSVR
jgi:hypothetical protein